MQERAKKISNKADLDLFKGLVSSCLNVDAHTRCSDIGQLHNSMSAVHLHHGLQL